MNDEGHKGLWRTSGGFGGGVCDLGEKLRQRRVFRESGVVSALGTVNVNCVFGHPCRGAGWAVESEVKGKVASGSHRVCETVELERLCK